MAGVMEIGRTKVMTSTMQMALRGILKPYNMDLDDIEQPSFSPISILIGNDHLSLQLEDHPGLKGLARPENLKFKVSPVMSKPVAVGRVYGPQEWTLPQHDVTLVKKKIEQPVQVPAKQWEGFSGLRSAKVIQEEKKQVDWDTVMNMDENTHLQNHFIQQEYHAEHNSIVNNYFVTKEEASINTDSELISSLEETHPAEEDNVFMDCYTTEQQA